jgi:hypothetical protein
MRARTAKVIEERLVSTACFFDGVSEDGETRVVKLACLPDTEGVGRVGDRKDVRRGASGEKLLAVRIREDVANEGGLPGRSFGCRFSRERGDQPEEGRAILDKSLVLHAHLDDHPRAPRRHLREDHQGLN